MWSPRNYPYWGPSSSEDVGANRFGVALGIDTLDDNINGLTYLVDPDSAGYQVPGIGLNLAVGMASATSTINGANTTIGAQNFILPATSDCYVDGIPYGNGDANDFPQASSTILVAVSSSAYLQLQNGGTHSGAYLIGYPGKFGRTNLTNVLLYGQSTLDISQGYTVTIEFNCDYQAGTNPSHGPAIMDINGNGYVIQFLSNGGTVNRLVGGVPGVVIFTIPTGTYGVAGPHLLRLDITWNSGSWGSQDYDFDIYVDDTSNPLVSGSDSYGTLDPTTVYPGFYYNTGQAWLYSWDWEQEDGPFYGGWQITPVKLGGHEPHLSPGGNRFFVLTTSSLALTTVREVFPQYTLLNQIAFNRDTANLLLGAYN